MSKKIRKCITAFNKQNAKTKNQLARLKQKGRFMNYLIKNKKVKVGILVIIIIISICYYIYSENTNL